MLVTSVPHPPPAKASIKPPAVASQPEISNIQLSTLQQTAFALYPNPSNGMVALRLNNSMAGKFTVTLTTIDGKQVYQKTIDAYAKGSTVSLNVSQLKSGTYIVNVIGNKTSWTSRLVIAK